MRKLLFFIALIVALVLRTVAFAAGKPARRAAALASADGAGYAGRAARVVVVFCVAILMAVVCASAEAGVRDMSVQFAGRASGPYRDVTRFLHDVGRECYARETVDEQVSLAWSVRWPHVRVAAGNAGLPVQVAPATGSVEGSSTRDGCDEPDEADPMWVGRFVCQQALRMRGPATLTLSRQGGRLLLMLHAPLFADPEAPCDTTIRNEELVAHFALPRSGRTITAQLGSEHPGPGDSYAPVRLCDELPHIYDGFVWLYSCEDELTWQGTLTIRRR